MYRPQLQASCRNKPRNVSLKANTAPYTPNPKLNGARDLDWALKLKRIAVLGLQAWVVEAPNDAQPLDPSHPTLRDPGVS